MNIDSFIYKNAVATSEGAIVKAIENSKKTISNSNILILGFGRIGKILSNILKGFSANIYVEARKTTDLALIDSLGFEAIDIKKLDEHLNKFDYIFNTIPSLILDDKKLELVKSNATIIDLASFPGGIDFNKARELNLNVDLTMSLPSKITPITAAYYMEEEISKLEL